MKKILFLLMVPMLLLCSGYGSVGMEEIDSLTMDGGTSVLSYNIALKFVTSDGGNLVGSLPGESYTTLHMNWGWGGKYNGNYIQPSTSNGHYTSNQEAIFVNPNK